MRADSGFYVHAIVAVCRKMDVRFSITIRQHKSLRNLIEAIPEADWTPIPYWMDGAADVAETTYTPFQSEPDAAPVRLIVRRVKPTPGSQLALFASYSYHGFITDRDGEMLELEADHRRHAEIENAIRDLKYGVGLNHLPSGRFAANGAWLAVQVMAHNLARWTARIGLGEQIVTIRPSGGGSSPWPDGSPARRAASLCISPSIGPGKPSSIVPWPDCAPCHSLPDGGGGNRPPSGQPKVPANSRQSGLRVPLAASSPRYLALINTRRRSQSLPAATEDRHRPSSTPNRARTIALPCPYRLFRYCIVIPSVDLGLIASRS